MNSDFKNTISSSPVIEALFPGPDQTADVEAGAYSSAVMLIDKNGAILRANPRALQLLACDEEQALGRFYGLFLSVLQVGCDSHHMSVGLDPVQRCLVQGRPCFPIAGLVRGVDGAIHSIEGSVAPIYKPRCEIAGTVLLFQTLDNDSVNEAQR